jgi:hypothetical protein
MSRVVAISVYYDGQPIALLRADWSAPEAQVEVRRPEGGDWGCFHSRDYPFYPHHVDTFRGKDGEEKMFQRAAEMLVHEWSGDDDYERTWRSRAVAYEEVASDWVLSRPWVAPTDVDLTSFTEPEPKSLWRDDPSEADPAPPSTDGS